MVQTPYPFVEDHTMLRIAIILVMTAIGLATGVLVGLIGGAALVEAGRNSCSGAACADIVVRTCMPVAALLGAALGLAKGVNMVFGNRVVVR